MGVTVGCAAVHTRHEYALLSYPPRFLIVPPFSRYRFLCCTKARTPGRELQALLAKFPHTTTTNIAENVSGMPNSDPCRILYESLSCFNTRDFDFSPSTQRARVILPRKSPIALYEKSYNGHVVVASAIAPMAKCNDNI